MNSMPTGFKAPHLLSGFDEKSAVLVGLSGGSDSTALLHLLCRYAEETGAKIFAAHVNHGIRGDEADRDECFCKTLAENLGVKFFSLRADVPKIAKGSGESIETAARRVRYEYFDRLMRENNIKVLATAHNADDNLETILFNIARGTGLGGLCGIPDCRPCECGVVVRPILGMEKKDIVAYCKENDLEYVTDSTNTDTDYTRNKIRAEIIPVMKQINSGAVRNAARMSESLRADSLCLESMAGWFIEELRDNYSIETEKICGSPSSVVNRALIRLYDEISGGKTLEQAHINALRALAQKGIPHSSASLPGGIEAVIENKKLCLIKKEDKPKECDSFELALTEGSNLISQTNSEIVIGTSQSSKNVYKKSTLLSIASDKIEGGLIARNRMSGDKIRIGGMSKSVKKLMCDKKIAVALRSRLPVICDDNGILAIPFIGIRDGAKFSSEKDCSSSKIDISFYLY